MKLYRETKSLVWNLFLMALGSFLCAVAIQGVLVPKEFLAGGITGLALLIHYMVAYLPVGLIYFLLNIPLFVMGWMYVGRRFFFYSVAGMTLFSLMIFIPCPEFPIQDRILNALTAGILSGVGGGIILRSLGSAGGLDILSVILMKRYSIRLGTTVLFFNAILMVVAVFRLPLEQILYTLIYMYVSSHSVNYVVTGLSQRKAVLVISPRWEMISEQIMSTMNRGVTILKGQGGYSGEPENILYSVITLQELGRFKSMVRNQDPNAFVVISDTLEVMGTRIGNQPHW